MAGNSKLYGIFQKIQTKYSISVIDLEHGSHCLELTGKKSMRSRIHRKNYEIGYFEFDGVTW